MDFELFTGHGQELQISARSAKYGPQHTWSLEQLKCRDGKETPLLEK